MNIKCKLKLSGDKHLNSEWRRILRRPTFSVRNHTMGRGGKKTGEENEKNRWKIESSRVSQQCLEKIIFHLSETIPGDMVHETPRPPTYNKQHICFFLFSSFYSIRLWIHWPIETKTKMEWRKDRERERERRKEPNEKKIFKSDLCKTSFVKVSFLWK